MGILKHYFFLQEFINRPRTDCAAQTEIHMESVFIQTDYLLESVHIQTENPQTSTSTQTVFVYSTACTQTEQHCEVKQCQTDGMKVVNCKTQTDEIKQNHFQVQVNIEPVITVSVERKYHEIGIFRYCQNHFQIYILNLCCFRWIYQKMRTTKLQALLPPQ